MDLNQTEIIIIISIVAILIYGYTTNRDDDGRIKDSSVDTDNVLESIEEFEPKLNSKLKDGYTEKSIQNQLKKHLQEEYVSVIDEYGIEGANGTKIDFDIGNGKVGLELKLAKSLFKKSNEHRLNGQIDDYIGRQDDNDNLIVAGYGEKQHTSERARLNEIRKKVESKNAIFTYIEIS